MPALWKKALITSIPKIVGNPPTTSELHVISILPTASKILEKMVKNEIFDFITTYKLLPEFQSGFRAHHSCATEITSDIANVCIVVTAVLEYLST